MCQSNWILLYGLGIFEDVGSVKQGLLYSEYHSATFYQPHRGNRPLRSLTYYAEAVSVPEGFTYCAEGTSARVCTSEITSQFLR